MNANFGILKPLGYKVKGGKVAKYEKLAERSLALFGATLTADSEGNGQ